MSSFFVGRRRAKRDNIPIIPLAAYPRGKALMQGTAAGEAALAEGLVLGFLSRDVTASGVDTTILYKAAAGIPMLEQPDRTGENSSLEFWEEFEVEGPDFVQASGATGTLSSSETLGTTKISWTTGLAYKLQTGNLDQGFRLKEILPAEDSANTARFVIERVQ